ncbi:phage shock protein operon transcriptional activator [Catenovulum maritimum]|uniref:ATPase AAA n=1 Tax=Catenovulum maritimum TaxID=1513271 RepID=A0A0J8GNI3_9ALTE|nr:phage shock protein operon transcriptional activator [Catenovulum maritimum]KMT64360.1 ATPase AAA [Catenovulum maritimum]
MANSTNNDNLIGQSHYFLAMLDHISQLAPLTKPVLIIGERGTGKELVAERLHFLSQRWQEEFIKLNCAAVNDNLLESELFGHETGSFTGANKRHLGKFERADGGTLFLDELATTSTLVQEKLLRVIEYGEFERVGGSQTIQTDVRIIAATNEDLPKLAELGQFRADLLDRLAFDVINVPPLRARKSDILELAEHFAINMARELKHELFSGFSAEAQQALLAYDWPGNIRELKNVIERSVYRANTPDTAIDTIIFDPFKTEFEFTPLNAGIDEVTSTSANNKSEEMEVASQPKQQSVWPIDFKQTCQQQEVELIKQALEQAKFNQKQAAQLLSISYHQLRGYLKKYNLV